MRHFFCFFLGTALVAAITIGCQPAKELPDEVPERKVTTTIDPDPYGKASEESEKEAKAVADRAVKAITQDRIEVQAKARICRVTANGKYQLPNTPTMTDAVRNLLSVWPDRVLTTYEFKDGAFPKMTFGLHSPFGWRVIGKEPYKPVSDPTALGLVIMTDIIAQQWIPLSLAFTDHKAIFFAIQQNTPKAGQTAFKFAMKETKATRGMPVIRVVTNDQSGLPVSVDYYPLDLNPYRVHREFQFSDYKDAAGLMLPTSLEMTQNEQSGERWVIDKWEFSERYDETVFDPPK